jgi:hypothetical protein
MSREAAAAKTRADFPTAVAFADLFALTFGPVSLKHAEEGGRSIGKPAPKGLDWFAMQSSKRAEFTRRKA